MFGFEIMESDKCIVTLSWDKSGVNVELHIDKTEYNPLLNRLFYEHDSITWADMLFWLERRCLPRDQIGVEHWIHDVYKLKEYRPYEIVRKTHGISMTDCIWVRWFDEFDLVYGDLDKGSLVAGSGHQEKYWSGRQLIKFDSSRKESKKEFAASMFGSSVGIDVVEYNRGSIDDRNVCICHSFLNTGESSVNLYSILELFDVVIPQNMCSVEYFNICCNCVDSVTHLGIENIKMYLMYMLVFDYIIANSDRHLSNIEFIRGSGYYRFPPVFDNGKAFFCTDKTLTGGELQSLSRKYKSMPFSRNPRSNLIDLDLAKSIGQMYYSRLDLSSLDISESYKKIIKYRFNLLFNL